MISLVYALILILFLRICYRRILRWIDEYEAEEDLKKQSSLRFVILDMSAVSAIDTSGVSFFKDLRKIMEKKGVQASINKLLLHFIQLVLVNPLAEVIEKLQRSDEAGNFRRPDSLFLTVGEAVASLSSTMKGQSSTHV
ncbi:hypothetical protein Pint_22273 [Pistacia integerrima]|uniref:Uncharacterized protein n=1 Tax=Pistacia integerrima TaxID=434235 RepID=A0ACC0YIM3_9ROSI|nr:hypothetical protein Pint_22273 [Pistacia integerrima]